MIKKVVLAFLLLFFSSVSFASFEFYPTGSVAYQTCSSDSSIFNSSLSQSSTTTVDIYGCSVAYDSVTRTDVYYLNFSRCEKLGGSYTNCTILSPNTSIYRVCNSPKIITDSPSVIGGLNYSNSCISPPVCTAPKILSFSRDSCIEKSECLLPLNVVNAAQTACIARPICSPPQVLNADLNQCIDSPKPNYKKWVKNKSLGVSQCNIDSVDSKFLALTPDPYPGMIMCTEESTRVTLRIGSDAASAVIINEYSICEFPKKITDVPSGGYINSCGDAPPDGTKTSCPTGQMLYKGNCYNVMDSSAPSTSSSSTSSGSTSGDTSGSTSTGSTSGDTSGSTSGSTGGSTSTGSTSGDTSGSTSGSTGGSTSTGSTSTTSSGSTSTGSTSGGDVSFTCSDGSVISPPLDCPAQYCGYLNGVYACYDAVGNIDSTGSTSTTSGGSTSTSSTSGDTSTTSGGSTSTGSTSGGITGSTSTTSTTSGSTTTSGDTSGSTSSGSTSTSSTSGDTSTTSGGSTSTGSTSGGITGSTSTTSSGTTTSGDTSGSTSGSTSTGSTGGTTTSGDTSGSTSGSTSTGSTSGGTTTSGDTSGSTSGSTSTGSTSGSTSTTSSGSTSTGSTSGSTSTTSGGSTSTGSTSSGSSDGIDSQGIIDAIKGLQGVGSKKTLNTGDKGDFGTAADDALENVKSDLTTKMNEVKSGINNLKPHLFGGGGYLPSWNFGQIKGVDIELDLNKYSDFLGVISSSVMFLAAVMAFRIVLGG